MLVFLLWMHTEHRFYFHFSGFVSDWWQSQCWWDFRFSLLEDGYVHKYQQWYMYAIKQYLNTAAWNGLYLILSQNCVTGFWQSVHELAITEINNPIMQCIYMIYIYMMNLCCAWFSSRNVIAEELCKGITLYS